DRGEGNSRCFFLSRMMDMGYIRGVRKQAGGMCQHCDWLLLHGHIPGEHNVRHKHRLHLNEKFVAHLPQNFGVVLQDQVSTRVLFGRVETQCLGSQLTGPPLSGSPSAGN
ncbi:unnamed protein product, partial [Ectocarpus sp. 12 AP-2014]